jgi:hypothetical protein
MKWMFPVIVVAWCSMAAAQVATGSDSGLEEKRMHVETTFKVVVHAPYAEAAELFGPEGERAWAGKHWDPQFLHPMPGRDEEGAVFTIKHGSLKAVWVVAQHDVDARHFQYVYFIPDVMVTTIDVWFESLDQKTTQVAVTYARTAISPDGEAHVKAMSEGDQTAGKDWQESIDKYLASRAPAQAR